MFILIHKHIQCIYLNIRILILEEACLATSYVAATFHPTIGQCAHQSLSIISNTELGMILKRNKGTLQDSHIAKDTTKTHPSQHSWVYQVGKELERLTTKLVSSTS